MTILVQFDVGLPGVNTLDGIGISSTVFSGFVSDRFDHTASDAEFQISDPTTHWSVVLTGSMVFDSQHVIDTNASSVTSMTVLDDSQAVIMSITGLPNAPLGAALNLTLDGFSPAMLGGQGFEMTGTNGDDVLAGNIGADTLAGGLGDDLYYVGPGDSVIDSGGDDDVLSSVSWVAGDGIEQVELLGTADLDA